MDGRRASVQDAIWIFVKLVHGHRNSGRVQIFENLGARVGGENAVTQERRHRREMTGGESLTERTRTRGSREQLSEGMPIVKAPRQELTTQKLQMVVHRQHQRLVMEVF